MVCCVLCINFFHVRALTARERLPPLSFTCTHPISYHQSTKPVNVLHPAPDGGRGDISFLSPCGEPPHPPGLGRRRRPPGPPGPGNLGSALGLPTSYCFNPDGISPYFTGAWFAEADGMGCILKIFWVLFFVFFFFLVSFCISRIVFL